MGGQFTGGHPAPINKSQDGLIPVTSDPVALARTAEVLGTIRASIEMAMMRPRNIEDAAKSVRAAVCRPSMAKIATYRLPRGNNPDVTGPSVGLAREIARNWGNLKHGFRVVSQSDTEVHLEGFAWDFETMNQVQLETKFNKTVPRKRDGKTVYIKTSDSQLAELISARGAKLERNAILALIPADLVDEFVNLAFGTIENEKVAEAEAQIDPQELITKACLMFDQWGIKPEQVDAYVALKGEWSPKAIAHLEGLKTAIQEEQVDPGDVFPPLKVESEPANSEQPYSKSPFTSSQEGQS